MKTVDALRELNKKLINENERLKKENDELREGIRIMNQVAMEEIGKYQARYGTKGLQ